MSELPTGTVTFLLTDIEGSTRLWEQYPDAMRDALARHDALLSTGIEQHGGAVIKSRGEGDSFFAVFARATDAVAAAYAIQRALVKDELSLISHPSSFRLRVRMALHTGEADLRGGDYYGAAVNRCARLRAVAHGGQTLLSLSTEELVRDALPKGASLKDLGTHRLQDLQRPEQVFQLLHPDLQADFPPLKSLTTLPNNLPQQLTSFVGREREMEEVKRLLSSTRLLTLTGAGGCGKSRLSLQVAADLLVRADLLQGDGDGVWLVELAPLSDPSLVAQTVATVLGVHEEAGRPILQTLTDYLKPKRLLLMLDNCEHLLSACAQLAETLLRACPHLHVLTTSREGLGIGGELTYRVPSLSLPDLKTLSQFPNFPISQLTQYESVRLFIERAVFSQPHFTVTNQNAPAVAQICWRLDGIPLAVELAAARVKMFTVEQIVARLDDRFRLLTGGSRTALPRQQTLRAAIDWSYDLLSESERALLRRLSVFAGGWTFEAAETVCSDIGFRISDFGLEDSAATIRNPQSAIRNGDVLDLLTRLVDKSLVTVEEGADRQARYRLLETVRQYARDRLLESGEGEWVRGRHLAYFLRLAEEAEPQLTGAEQAMWLEWLETEHDNLRAALAWSRVEKGEAETELRLAKALGRFWYVRGHLSEGRRWLEEALSRSEGLVAPTRALALIRAGALARDQGDFTQAATLHRESLALFRELKDKQGIAGSLHNLGLVACDQGDYAAAQSFYEKALPLWRELGDKRNLALSLNNLGMVAHGQGDYARAAVLCRESLMLFQEVGDKWGIATVLDILGDMACRQGDYEQAVALNEESLTISRELGSKRGIAMSLGRLGDVAQCQGDYEQAEALLQESLTRFRELGDKWGIAWVLNNLGYVAQCQQDDERARAFFEEILPLFRELGNKWGIARTLNSLGWLAQEQGDYATARALYEESLVTNREIGNRAGEANNLINLGNVAREQGDYSAARALLEESLVMRRELDDKGGIAECLEGFASLAAAQGQPERAARLFGAAESLCEASGAPVLLVDRAYYNHCVAGARAAGDEVAFAAAWAEGKAMTMEEAVEYALET